MTATALDWWRVVERYRTEVELAPLAGIARLRAVLVDESTIRISQKLWTASVTRADLETAVELLAGMPGPVSPVEFAERLRTWCASTTGCSRVPTVSAVLLTDLGLLPVTGR